MHCYGLGKADKVKIKKIIFRIFYPSIGNHELIRIRTRAAIVSAF